MNYTVKPHIISQFLTVVGYSYDRKCLFTLQFLLTSILLGLNLYHKNDEIILITLVFTFLHKWIDFSFGFSDFVILKGYMALVLLGFVNLCVELSFLEVGNAGNRTHKE